MSSTKGKWIYVLFICLLTAINLCAQDSTGYIVSKKLYTYVDGLPGREISCAVEDQHGFMWFGTKNGLCRFDGKNFLVFTSRNSGLYSNNIRTLITDNEHGLIIDYYQHNNIYDPLVSHIEVMDINTFKVSSFNQFYPNCPFKEEQIADIFDSRYGQRVVEIFLKPFHPYVSETKRHIYRWVLNSGVFRKDTIWAVKVLRFTGINNAQNITFDSFSDSSRINGVQVLVMNNGTLLPTSDCRLVFCDSTATIVGIKDSLGCRSFFYFEKSGAVKQIDGVNHLYHGIKLQPESAYFPGRESEGSAIVVDPKTNYMGIVIKDIGYLNIADSTAPQEIRKARILSYSRSKTGHFWLCTTEGVIKVTVRKKLFESMFTMEQCPTWNHHSTRGIVIENGNLYAAVGDKLCIKQDDNKIYIKSPGIFAAFKEKNTIWTGNLDLRLINIKSKKTTRLLSHRRGEVWCVYKLGEDQMLIGCTHGLFRYDIVNRTLVEVSHGSYPSSSLVYRIFKTSRDELFAIADNGIYVLNDEGNVINYYSSQSAYKFPFEHINDVCEDRSEPDVFWIATAGEGMFKWHRTRNRFEHFGIENGFLSEIMCRIEPDSFGYLWISTDFGIARFNKQTGTAEVFTRLDGIAHNEFNRSSSARGTNGTLCFGGIDGVTLFNPANFMHDKKQAGYSLVINKMTQYNTKTNKEEDIAKDYLFDKNVYITNVKRNLSLSVVLLDFEERNHLYEYRVEGFEIDWKRASDGLVEITGLPYGDYSLRIRAQNPDGTWNSSMILIPLHIVRPYYATWWFVSIIVGAVTILIILIVKFRTKNLRNEKMKLEQTVGVRTSELKTSLDQQTALLQELHHRVKNNLQIISSLISLQTNSSTDSSEIHTLNDASRRIRAVALVHEMLYKQDKAEIDIKFYLTELVSTINELVNVHQLPIIFDLDVDNIVLKVDQAVALGMITSELISNSIKYAFAGVKHPKILISLHIISEDNTIEYIVSDNGPGAGGGEVNDKSRFGIRLIDIFSRQIKGSHSFKSNNGFTYELHFKI